MVNANQDPYLGDTAQQHESHPASTAQAWTTTNPNPTDQSAVIQARIDAAWAAGGGQVRLTAGVFYGSFSMRPDVDLVGSGWQTVLRAMPGQTAPVIDYSTHNAFHTEVRDLRVDGNYIYNRTDGVTQGNCRCINMDTNPTAQTNWFYNNPGSAASTPVIADGGLVAAFGGGTSAGTGAWNDSANSLSRVMVSGCGGDWAVYLGANQRGAWMHNVFVYQCKNGAINNQGTDTQCTNVQAGGCGDGILIGNSSQSWTNCKSWFHGVNTGYTGNGDGWRISLPRDNTIGPTRLTGCESQDNIRYGISVTTGGAVLVRGFVSGGDSGAAIYLNDAKDCDFDVYLGTGDRTQGTVGVIFDGTGTKPVNNRVKFSADLTQFGASLALYNTINGAGIYDGNQIVSPLSQSGLTLYSSFSASTFTPTMLQSFIQGTLTGGLTINAPAPSIVGSAVPGEDWIISLMDQGTGGRVVTWNAAYHGAPAITTVTNKISTARFVYMGSGIWMCTGSTVNG